MDNDVFRIVDEMKEIANDLRRSNMTIPQIDSRETLHPAMDVYNGHLMYGVPNGKNPLFLSNRKLITLAEIEQTRRLENYPTQLRFSQEAIEKYLNGEALNPVGLYESIRGIIVKHMIFQFDWQASVVVVRILRTYLHRIFLLYPYLWFKSPVKRCGKTTLQEIVSAFAFNADAPETSVTEATLFRVPAITGGALIWDEAEGTGKNKDRTDLLSILNTGYRRGVLSKGVREKMLK